MERKIGEIFEHNGEWCQCVESKQDACTDCAFNPINGIGYNCSGSCTYKQVIFKKLEKVGEPYKFGRKLMQKYNIYAKPYLSDDYGYIYIPGRYNEVISIEIKQNKENMEEQHSTENYPKEDEVATRIANKVGEDIREQLEKNLNKEDMEEKKIQLSEEEYDYVKNEIENHILPGKLNREVYEDKVTENIMKLFSVETNYSNSEKIGKNLKPFDLQKAREGKPVCTRDGRKARIICFDKKKDIYPLIALVTDKDGYEIITPYKADGVHPIIPNNDLMMLPEKKEGWVNVYKKSIYKTKEDAFNRRDKENYLMTIKVGWEE